MELEGNVPKMIILWKTEIDDNEMFKVADKKELLTDAVRQNHVLYDQGH